MTDQDEPIDVVQSAGALDPVVVLLREFLHRSGAVRAVAVVADGDPEPAVVDCVRLQPIEVSRGESTVVLPHAIPLDVVELPVPDVKQLPPFEVKASALEIASPLGGLEHYALSVRALADAVPGDRSVALATWSTNDADTPLSITARSGDPFVLTLGEEEIEMDADWPAITR